MRFWLPSIKCSASPSSFRLCCLNCAQRFDLITTRSAVVGSWKEPTNTWLTVVKNAFKSPHVIDRRIKSVVIVFVSVFVVVWTRTWFIWYLVRTNMDFAFSFFFSQDFKQYNTSADALRKRSTSSSSPKLSSQNTAFCIWRCSRRASTRYNIAKHAFWLANKLDSFARGLHADVSLFIFTFSRQFFHRCWLFLKHYSYCSSPKKRVKI